MYKNNHHYSVREQLQIILRIFEGEYGSHGIQKYMEMILCFIKLFMPGFWIRGLIKDYYTRNTVLELYIILKVVILAGILFYEVASNLATVVAAYFLVDIVQHLFSLIFLSKMFAGVPSLKKNFAHLGLNILEIVLAFAVFYLHFHAVGHAGVATADPLSILYFSMVTFATVGYGDLGPITALGKVLVGSQIMVSFLFVTIICGSFVTDLSNSNE